MTRQFDSGTLAAGQVSNSQAAIYTAPSGGGDVAVYVRSLSLYSTNAAAQTLKLWVKRSGGTSRRWRPRFVFAQDESAEVLDEGNVLLLSPGDAIEAETTTNNGVDYVITGVVETEV